MFCGESSKDTSVMTTRFSHRLTASIQHLVVGFEHQVFEAGAEFRTHEAFARARAENLDDALVNVFMFPGGGRGDLGPSRAALEAKRELQAFPEKIESHQSHSSQMMVD